MSVEMIAEGYIAESYLEDTSCERLRAAAPRIKALTQRAGVSVGQQSSSN